MYRQYYRSFKMKTCFHALIIFTIFVSNQYRVTAELPLRIINGTTAEEGEFPYAVQLIRNGGYFFCGGSIIAPEWILTAGHCIPDIDQGSIVIYGTTKFYDRQNPPNTSIAIKQMYQHPKFAYNNHSNPMYDVGIVQLAKPISFSDSAQSIQLAEDDTDIPVHVDGVLCGWGGINSLGTSPLFLQKISLQLLTDEECTEQINDYGKSDIFNSSHNLCSNDYYNGGCYGDSGSPYVINGTQYGFISWSLKPCYGVVPNTYTRITNPEYRSWIKYITGV